MATIEQIRAARALLGWSQQDLADRAGLSQTGIARIENGAHKPNSQTLSKIIHALGKEGVTFTEKGLEKDDYPVYYTSGKNHEQAYLRLLEDAYEHLRSIKNPELLVMFADDSVSPPAVNGMYRRIRADGIKMRQLIKEGNTHIVGPLEEYRYIPKDFFINRVTLVYGNRIANESADVCRGVIRVDPVNANIQRNMFNVLWRVLKKPEETTADERF
ncbi:MAG: helix-turn-helix transcriptional regulator [Proteobacteria bacterium]|nr:helix-turn-helix transcriptional regulator [Pseudomonadota bacterium]